MFCLSELHPHSRWSTWQDSNLHNIRVRSAAAHPVHATGAQLMVCAERFELPSSRSQTGTPQTGPCLRGGERGPPAGLGYAQKNWQLRRISRPRHSRLQHDALPSELRSRSWWTRRILKSRPPHCKCGALPTELQAHVKVGGKGGSRTLYNVIHNHAPHRLASVPVLYFECRSRQRYMSFSLPARIYP